MEDRCTPVLYLELGDVPPEACAERADALLRVPGATRVTCWENCALGRTDLPMRVNDGNTLLVVEADDGFVSPPLLRARPQPICSSVIIAPARASSPGPRRWAC